MTVSSAELVAAVSKLNDLTRRRSINWSAVDDSGEGSVIASYCAPYEGRIFRITEHEPTAAERRYDRNPKNRYKLEILDDRNNPIFVFPDISGINDLFASIQARTGNPEEVIRSLLNAK
jgi:hypothetical protein